MRTEQSSEPQPSMHSQLPCTHAPWAEQSLGHSAFSQASPLKPAAQMHVPLTHVPGQG